MNSSIPLNTPQNNMPNGARRSLTATPHGRPTPQSYEWPPPNRDWDPPTLVPMDQDELASHSLMDEDLETQPLDGEQDISSVPPPPPPGHREISSLASWTVSTHKPGCSVAALRAPSTNLYWQSDGPQPHHLNIHFFKMVAIAGMRIYLSFDDDESYTPTLIRFAAGTGYHDLQEFSVMRFEKPNGWINVEWEGVGEGDDEVLRCMLVQVRICENHQNGKDTHLRGLQIFARDKSAARVQEEREEGTVDAQGRTVPVVRTGTRRERQERKRETLDFDLDGWMDPPVIR
jgi:anaphase-promoting complex subunit 10